MEAGCCGTKYREAQRWKPSTVAQKISVYREQLRATVNNIYNTIMDYIILVDLFQKMDYPILCNLKQFFKNLSNSIEHAMYNAVSKIDCNGT